MLNGVGENCRDAGEEDGVEGLALELVVRLWWDVDYPIAIVATLFGEWEGARLWVLLLVLGLEEDRLCQ